MKNLGCKLGCIQTLGCKLGSMDTKNKMLIGMQTIVEVRIVCVGEGRATSSLRLRRLFACSLRVLVFSQERCRSARSIASVLYALIMGLFRSKNEEACLHTCDDGSFLCRIPMAAPSSLQERLSLAFRVELFKRTA